ncbi:MAG TPA: hypothetical protein VFW23_00300 [Tepidisphaeraceae bacterium]|nr:hypothetical protein [Tepidisphaeraceae bacterium]
MYLACSWTWCIGMFLPVLMVREFGFLGWVVFAVPNVIGAAGLGWVLSKPGAVERIVARHAVACQAFSAVTIAFHCFFMGWLVRGMVGWPAPVVCALATLIIFLVTRGGKRELITAVAIYAISLIAIALALSIHGIPANISPPVLRQGLGLFWLAPVVVFGFVLCPYLDLTFHRARSMTSPIAGVASFTLGFGLFFVVMILFTLWYAPLLRGEAFDQVPVLLLWIIGIHMIFQAAFTIALHLRPLTAADAQTSIKSFAVAISIIALLIGWLGLGFGGGGLEGIALRGERVYRFFMAFYGLIFPAYVWLCMIPTRDGDAGPNHRKLIVLGVTILMVAPLFYLGFIEDRMIWLVPGLVLLLLSRAFLPGGVRLAKARPSPAALRT